MPFSPKLWQNDISTELTAEAMIDLEVRTTDYTDDQVTGLAPLASPALTGTPTAPSPTAGDDSTKIATTAFVTDAVAAGGGGGGGPLSWSNIATFGTNWSSGGSDNHTSGSYTFPTASVAIDSDDVVHLRGFLVKSTTWSFPEAVCILPSGFRPSEVKRFHATVWDGPAGHFSMAVLDIEATGSFPGRVLFRGLVPYDDAWTLNSANAQLHLDGITFEA
jgi:hypothetical protein